MPIFSPRVQKTLQSYIKSVEGLEHLPKSGAYIIAANHNNHLDSFILSSIVQKEFNKPVKFLSRKTIFLWRVLGEWGAQKLSAILIDPAKKGASLDAALDALNKGEIIGNYPEARLNDSNQLMPGRSGTARMALWSGLPVIPAGISEGPGAHGWLNLMNDILFKFKGSTRVRFGSPLRFNRYHDKFIPKDLLDETTDAIMSAIAPLCEKAAP